MSPLLIIPGDKNEAADRLKCALPRSAWLRSMLEERLNNTMHLEPI